MTIVILFMESEIPKQKIVTIQLSFPEDLFNLEKITSEYIESVLVKKGIVGRGVSANILEIKTLDIDVDRVNIIKED